MLLFAFTVLALCLICAMPAFAQFPGLCSVVAANMNGGGLNLGPAAASIAVIGLGVGATFGKVSWSSAVTVAVGIAVMFGYQSLGGGC